MALLRMVASHYQGGLALAAGDSVPVGHGALDPALAARLVAAGVARWIDEAGRPLVPDTASAVAPRAEQAVARPQGRRAGG